MTRSGAWALVAVGVAAIVLSLTIWAVAAREHRLGEERGGLEAQVAALKASVGELRREAASLRRYADWLYEWVPRHVDAAISDLEHNEGLIWAWLEEITGERR